ncbi:MAG: deoxyribose-phosphate aldolase [Flavipsychrobacter sp.]|nr:deoxyribose-phosphate aldolase [Flavipsychrobacter sp.]
MNLAPYIEHTILKQATTIAEVDRICLEASEEGFVGVCVPPKYVQAAKKLLDGSGVKVSTVVGFPLGFGSIETKVKEIDAALHSGADEVDMVIDLGAIKSGDWKHLDEEIVACLKPIYAARKVIKVIVESGILTANELLACCALYGKHEIDYMKTSTGFADKGVTVEAVKLMRSHLPQRIGIKASGGIRTYNFAKELIEAGATRLGTSASMQIMKESREAV